ncbi:glycosyltransferase family protein [Tissierella praeacuta]|uniref:glycosyltransferase family protein n=1 Tax=Tissierella praeacuta TaxID=43131 RepID=UPI0028AD6ABC|nr:glycosyltransferase family protein [Tissierella praeacuta]
MNKKNLKVGVIIQARMMSSRLPGKVMKLLKGEPMLWHIIKRVSEAKLVDEIIIATTDNEADMKIIEFCNNNKVKYFIGSELDVLKRYYEAALSNKLDVVVRVTSDCPLIDPNVIDKLIELYIDNNEIDYVTNSIVRTYPRGLECSAFSFKSLERSHIEARDARHREHVVLYIRENPSKFNILNLENYKDLSNYRLTVDTIEDFNLIFEIYERLYEEDKTIKIEDAISLLEENKDLVKINAHIKQKER